MKKFLLGIFLLMGILSFAERRITIKSGSYCTGYLGNTDYGLTTDEGTPFEYYMFKKCVINGKTYYGNNSQAYPERAALGIYYNSSSQQDYFTELIEKKGRVYLKPGVTAVDEGEGNWGINVNKIEIK